MKARCADKTRSGYGARGLQVCTEWASFSAFRDWALAHGYTDKLTIDRNNNDLGYSPENCTWQDKQQQAVNRRFVLRDEAGRAWCEIAKSNGIPVTLMHGRIHEGWPIEKAATLPKGSRVSR
jgi:hypothetical protein